MTRTIIDLDNGLKKIILDFSDEIGDGGSSYVSTTIVDGDAQVYADVMASDFRRNNASLFPVVEPETDVGMELGGDEA